MRITATLESRYNNQDITVSTEGAEKRLTIPVKSSGYGSSVNGGEFLLLSLATCFCNDIYREAAKRNLAVTAVTVYVSAEFGAEGEAGSGFRYKVDVIADATPDEIRALVEHTDKVAEIHNTLRKGVNITIEKA